MDTNALAWLIAGAIMDDLRGRSGIIDGLDEDTVDEIMHDHVDIIEMALKNQDS